MWEDLLLGVIGEQFTYPDEITGIVISIRNNQDTISVWNRSGSDLEVIKQIKADIIRICGLLDSASMDYDQFCTKTDDVQHWQSSVNKRKAPAYAK